MQTDLAGELAALAELSADALRARWRELTGSPPPRVRPGLLRQALAFELQAASDSSQARQLRQRLDQAAAGRTVTTPAVPGMKLVREWNGVLHTVTIGEDRSVRWDGRTWNSLSEVARAITGTRWSGPAFFGLKKRKAA